MYTRRYAPIASTVEGVPFVCIGNDEIYASNAAENPCASMDDSVRLVRNAGGHVSANTVTTAINARHVTERVSANITG